MRNKNTHSLTLKCKLSKCDKTFIAYSELQFKYGQILDKRVDVLNIKANYALKDFELGNNYTSDFVCKKSNDELMVRECINRKNIMRPTVIKLLDAVRNYWLSRGVSDWGNSGR